MDTKFKLILTGVVFLLFSIIVVGLSWLALAGEGVSLILSYTAGLSMIFLPCTLPLVFVIVPLALGKSPRKGLTMALLFGLGLTVTITLYGIFISQIGAYLGLDRATQIMFIIAGILALTFGLSELNLANIKIPGHFLKIPALFQQKGDYLRAFGLGLFLGNAGVGCPNPAFYVLLTYIAAVGSAGTGAVIGAVHGIGRATPLILFAILGILGVNTVSWVRQQSFKINKWMGWALVFVGAFILTYGLFGMHWWEDSIFHAGWNSVVYSISPAIAEAPDHPVAPGAFQGPMWLGWVSFMVFSAIPIIWYSVRFKLKKASIIIVLLIYALIGGLLATGNLKASDAHGVLEEGDVHQEEGGLPSEVSTKGGAHDGSNHSE